jgi:hypothetical protein
MNRGGRPRGPSARTNFGAIAAATSMGTQQIVIADELGIDVQTVRKWQRDDTSRALIRAMQLGHAEQWSLIYARMLDSLVQDYQAATTLRDRQSLREETVRLLRIGDPMEPTAVTLTQAAQASSPGDFTLEQLLVHQYNASGQ